MNTIRGYIRICFIILVVSIGTILVLTTFWMPWRFKGIRLSAWLLTYMARLFMIVFDIRYVCPEPQKFFNFEGFVFPNHSSYLDILMMVHMLPMRFVAKWEVLFMPLVGILAWTIGCVFVKRESKTSRQKVRTKLGQIDHYPPIVLFPEGKTNRGSGLLPFRHGAFAIAAQHEVPCLPCLLIFDRPEIARWEGDPFWTAFWRLATRRGPLTASIIPLETIHPTPDDDPAQLAEETREKMLAALEAHQ